MPDLSTAEIVRHLETFVSSLWYVWIVLGLSAFFVPAYGGTGPGR